MSVGVNVSADVESTVGGIRRVTRELEDLRRQVERVNGDLSKLNADDRAVWEDLQRRITKGLDTPVGRSTKRRVVDQTGNADPSLHDILNTPLHVDPAEDALRKRNLIETLGGPGVQVNGGRRGGAAPPAGGGSRIGAGAGSIVGAVLGGGGGMIGGMAGGALMGPVGAAVGGIVGSKVAGAMGPEEQRLIDLDHFTRALGKGAESFDVLNSAVAKTADELHVSYQRGQQIMREYAARANLDDEAAIEAGAIRAGKFARQNGMAPELGGSIMGRVRMNVQDDTSERRFAALLSNTLEKAGGHRRSEIAQALVTIQDNLTSRNLTAPNMSPYTNMVTAMNETGLAGFQGERGIGAINQMNSWVTSPSNGGPGSVFRMQAVMREMPQLRNDPLLYEYMKSEGMGASITSMLEKDGPVGDLFRESGLKPNDTTVAQALAKSLAPYGAWGGLALSNEGAASTPGTGLAMIEAMAAGGQTKLSMEEIEAIEAREAKRNSFSTTGSKAEENAADISQAVSAAAEKVVAAITDLKSAIINPESVGGVTGVTDLSGGILGPSALNMYPSGYFDQLRGRNTPAGRNTSAPSGGSSQ